jgi:cytochrome c553
VCKKISVTILFSYTATLFAAGNPVAGKDKAIICIGCHGFDGNSDNGEYPKLAEQHENYLIKQLLDFKSGARKEEHMSSMIEAIDKSDIPDVAAFFASQKRKTHRHETNTTDNIKKDFGKQIYQNGLQNKNIPACTSCHGEKAEGITALNSPSLTHQHTEYIAKMLKDFRSNTRSNDPGKMMRTVAAKLTDEEINALANYISNL